MFKTLSALAIASLAVTAAPANAVEYREGHINGYVVEILESGSFSAPDFINAYGPNGPEQITVTCAPYDWESYGANSASWVDSLAREWCFGS